MIKLNNKKDDNKIYINENSVKSIYIDICFNDIVIATATGFIVNKGNELYLITNRHVVTGRNNETGECLDTVNSAIPNNIKIMFPYIKDGKWRWDKIMINLFDSTDKEIWLEHPIFKNKIDVVAIKLHIDIQTNFFYNVETNYEICVTDSVFIVGYPFGFDVNPKNGKYAIWSSGIIASEPGLDLNINDEQLPAFLVDAKTRQGQSGSPVFYYSPFGVIRTKNGISVYGKPLIREIGIYSGRINKDSDLGYVWKWSLISEIINQ